MWRITMLVCALSGCGSKDSGGKPAAKAVEMKADAKTDAWLAAVEELQERINLAQISFTSAEPSDPNCGRMRQGVQYLAKLRESFGVLQAGAPAIPAACGRTLVEKTTALDGVFTSAVTSDGCSALSSWWDDVKTSKWEAAVCDLAMAANPCIDAALAAGATRKFSRLRSECAK